MWQETAMTQRIAINRNFSLLKISSKWQMNMTIDQIARKFVWHIDARLRQHKLLPPINFPVRA